MEKIIFIILSVFVSTAYANNNLNNSQSVSNLESNSVVGYISDTNINNNTKVPVAGAFAPLNVPTSDCLGSVSAGGQSQFMGFSFGFSRQSKPCNIRAYAKMFANEYPEISYAILCQDKIVRKGVEDAGYSCPIEDVTIKHNYPSSAGR